MCWERTKATSRLWLWKRSNVCGWASSRKLVLAGLWSNPPNGYLKSDGLKDTMLVNDVVAQYHKLDPVHFPIVLGTVEPSHGERSLPEIDRSSMYWAWTG